MKILIAEDDALFREGLKQILAPEHELLFTNNGDEAWAALQTGNPPRLAILDWVMPGLSGPQVCRNVRACTGLSSMYLILFTSRNSTADVISGFRAGADDYITKPFDPQELQIRVKLGKLVLDLQDAVESRLRISEERIDLQPRLSARRTLLFDTKPVGDDYLNRVEDCVIAPIPSTVISGGCVLQTSHPLPPEAAQYSLENLHG